MIDPGRTSFQTLYDRALPAVYSYLHQRLGADEALTMDVAQETFMTIVEQWPLPPDISNPMGYAVGIARHKMVDHLRRPSGRPISELFPNPHLMNIFQRRLQQRSALATYMTPSAECRIGSERSARYRSAG